MVTMIVKTSKYVKELVDYMRSIKAKWDRDEKTWTLDVDNPEAVRREVLRLDPNARVIIQEPLAPKEGQIRLRLSKDGRFAIININLLAFREDIQALLEGRRKSVRFRILPPKRRVRK